jgi:NAD(P)H-flavin reductase
MFRQYDHFVPQPVRIVSIRKESDDTRTYVLRLDTPHRAFDEGRPGQFVMLSVLGWGEAPFSLSALPGIDAEPGTAVVTVRRVGSLTSALFQMKEGAALGVRGPFGRGFPEPDPELPTLYVAGGCGLAPLKAAVDWHVARRAPEERLAVLYGARSRSTRIHERALAWWKTLPGVDVVDCVEHSGDGWAGRLGVVGSFIREAAEAIGAKRAAVCGPPVMLWDAARRLRAAGVASNEIHIAMERYMKCGTGHCGHCYIGPRYVCRDGPVFSYAELLELRRDSGALECGTPAPL